MLRALAWALLRPSRPAVARRRARKTMEAACDRLPLKEATRYTVSLAAASR